MTDIQYMQRALKLAAKGRGYTSPNPMVGAVVVREDRVVGEGWHEAVGQVHAEVNAIDKAGASADGATLYVTLEPCNHTGRTPPCTEKILSAGIRKVVMAMHDPNPNVTGGGATYLRQKGVTVAAGVCEAEARRLNETFIKHVHTGLPFVILKCAATLDGRIATRTGDAHWVTGPQARAHVHQLRHACDAIMVGIGTVIADNPRLTTRLEESRGKDPLRIILDTHLSIPENARVLQHNSDSDTMLVCSANLVDSRIKALGKKKGIRFLSVPEKEGTIDLEILMQRLGNMDITSILLEGGSRVSGSALKAGIVDKVLFYYAPKILGGDDGVPICRGQGPARMMDCLPVDDIRIRRFGEDILIEGYLKTA